MGGREQRVPSVSVLKHGDWVEVFVDTDPNGGPGFLRVVERGGAPGVAILPLRGEHVGLVAVFRWPLRRVMLEVPRGFGGEEDRNDDDARRELFEETGIQVLRSDLVPLGRLAPNSGLLASEVELFAAVIPPEEAGVRPLDTTEVSDFGWYPSRDVAAMIADGRITDGFTSACFLQAYLRGLIARYLDDE